MTARRLHPALLVHPVRVDGRRRLAAQSSASDAPLLLNSPLALAALTALPPEFDRESAVEAWGATGIAAHDGNQLWEAFEAAGLFAPAQPNGTSWWDEFGWPEARAYHEATRDYPFLQMDEPAAFESDSARMREYAAQDQAPPAYQRVASHATLELPRPGAGESPDEYLDGLAGDRRLGREGIGLLLDVCFGERGELTVADGSKCLLKSIPSGGARHPTEVFLAAFELEGIGAGVYHYDVEHHRLDQVGAGQQREAFAEATLDLFTKYESPPAAALVFTSRVERAMWRYRDPRSFRAILVDVGHAVMAYRQVARILGFRTFAYQKMHDSRVAELLGIDRLSQPPLYVGTLVP